ncbi:MAG TPA: formate dehydrogenase [Chromatiales bacterium]|nr:formate dehydrogenase [Chromatiales bacterium]
MMKERKTIDEARRNFLHSSAVVGVGAVAASAVPGAAMASVPEEKREETRSQGYRLSRHVLEYYKTAAN